MTRGGRESVAAVALTGCPGRRRPRSPPARVVRGPCPSEQFAGPYHGHCPRTAATTRARGSPPRPPRPFASPEDSTYRLRPRAPAGDPILRRGGRSRSCRWGPEQRDGDPLAQDLVGDRLGRSVPIMRGGSKPEQGRLPVALRGGARPRRRRRRSRNGRRQPSARQRPQLRDVDRALGATRSENRDGRHRQSRDVVGPLSATSMSKNRRIVLVARHRSGPGDGWLWPMRGGDAGVLAIAASSTSSDVSREWYRDSQAARSAGGDARVAERS